jgi:hypothetical protein
MDNDLGDCRCIFGKSDYEADYLIEYSKSPLFSREYKRHFGFAPSATN